MRRHIQSGHQPYWKRCRACVEGRSRDRPHRRQPVADTGVLALDLAGPFKTGKDERLPKIRYALVGVFVVADLPKLEQQERERLAKEDKGQEAEPGEDVGDERGHQDDGAGVWGPEEFLGGEGLAEELEWCVPDAPEEVADKERKALERPPDEVTKNLLISLPTKELTFTELLPSKHCSHVLLGVQRMEAQLRSMGFEIKRIHSDKGMEFQASPMQKWAAQRGITWSTTGADDFRQNVRVEAAIGRIKGLTTTLLRSASLPSGDWPYAWRWGVESLLRQVLVDMGGASVKEMLPFGARMFVKQRSWKAKAHEPKVVEATLLAPARDVAGSWLVRTVDNEYLATSVLHRDVLACPEPDTIGEKDKAPEAAPVLPVRSHRVTGKSKCAEIAVEQSSSLPVQSAIALRQETFTPRSEVGSTEACPAESTPNPSPSSARSDQPVDPHLGRRTACLEDVLQAEDRQASMIAQDPMFDLHRARSFLCKSHWSSKATASQLKGPKTRSAMHRGLGRHSGFRAVRRVSCFVG